MQSNEKLLDNVDWQFIIFEDLAILLNYFKILNQCWRSKINTYFDSNFIGDYFARNFKCFILNCECFAVNLQNKKVDFEDSKHHYKVHLPFTIDLQFVNLGRYFDLIVLLI